MNGNIKVSEQCRIAAIKSNPVVGMNRRHKYVFSPSYKGIVRCRL